MFPNVFYHIYIIIRRVWFLTYSMNPKTGETLDFFFRFTVVVIFILSFFYIFFCKYLLFAFFQSYDLCIFDLSSAFGRLTIICQKITFTY